MKTETKKPLRGERLAKAVVNQILSEPQTWDQRNWHSSCGTKHCFAGWCQIMSGKRAETACVMSDAKEALGITEYEAEALFAGDTSLSQLHYFAAHYSGDYRAGFDRDGFDRAGFNRAGFNRAGFDRDGFDRDGFNRAGFNRDGFDRDGFNRAGFNRAGFNRAGFNRDGFNRDGKKLEPFVI